MRVESEGRLTPENKVSSMANVSMAVVLTSRSRRREVASVHTHYLPFYMVAFLFFFLFLRVMHRFTQSSTLCYLVPWYFLTFHVLRSLTTFLPIRTESLRTNLLAAAAINWVLFTGSLSFLLLPKMLVTSFAAELKKPPTDAI